jgi:hypothetical protein
MSERIHATQVGAPDPELRSSPVLDESADDDRDGTDPESISFAHCHFNDVVYDDGNLVCSGDEMLKCQRGTWLRIGSCDQDNP